MAHAEPAPHHPHLPFREGGGSGAGELPSEFEWSVETQTSMGIGRRGLGRSGPHWVGPGISYAGLTE